ncbi:hypothetical protein [Xiamenia xianingshaonis]|nr:hypothetical protein [Xiamenia xianingshaonis]
MPFGCKKEHKELCLHKRKPGRVEIPSMDYAAIKEKGDPNDAKSV